MSSQLIFLVAALVAGCSANAIAKANEASVDVPNLWLLRVDIGNITNTLELASKLVIAREAQFYLELEYGVLSPISIEPYRNHGVINKNVTTDFDIVLRAPIFPQFRKVVRREDVVKNGHFDQIRRSSVQRSSPDIYFIYSPRKLPPSDLSLWEMDFNEIWRYWFDGSIYNFMFSIRKVEL